MLELINVSKSYDGQEVLKNINLSFPDNGLFCLCGASGCGKTTLLNLLSTIDNNYSGNIIFKNRLLRSFSNKDILQYRLKNIGYVFQTFNLFNSDNVYNNILFPLETISNDSSFAKNRKIDDVLEFVGLYNKKYQKVKYLSGGEKQRVSIARAIINEPDIILCDEPTGALDASCAEQILTLLKEISKKKLVIIVSHDIKLVERFVDDIYYLKDGIIVSHQLLDNNDEKLRKSPLFQNKISMKKPRLSLSFILRHIIENMKAKKFRTLLSNVMTSLGLMGIGMSLLISTSLSQDIKASFSKVINDQQIVASLKNPVSNLFGNVFSINEDEAKFIANRYSDVVDGVGVNYLVNFEDFFRTRNQIYVSSTPYQIPIEKFSLRQVNDYLWLSDEHEQIFPEEKSLIEDDQVILGLDYQSMAKLCFALSIQRDYYSLGQYIDLNDLTIDLDVANNNWQYEDIQTLKVVGVCKTDSNCFYHSSSKWNETFFQEKMRLPTTSNSDNVSYPWTMAKVYYLHSSSTDSFLEKAMYDDKMNDYVFEKASYSYYPNVCPLYKTCSLPRVLIFSVDKSCIKLSDIALMQRREPKLKNYLFSTDLGYTMYTSNLLLGFCHNFYLSNDEDSLDMAINADSKLSINDYNATIKLPDNVSVGNAFKSLSDGLSFSSTYKLKEGHRPLNIHEIVISSGLIKKFNNLPLNSTIYASMPISETIFENGNEKYYSRCEMNVVGVVNEEKDVIYSSSDWTISFFRDLLNISSFYLLPKQVIFTIDDSKDSSVIINKLNRTFKEYCFSNPSLEIGETIDSTLSYVETMLLLFSSIALLISLLLFILLIYMNVDESKNEIKLMNYIGISNKDIKRVFSTYSLVIGLIAFTLSSIEIIILYFISQIALKSFFSSTMTFNLSLWPFVVIFAIVILISFATNIFIKIKTSN